jgi:glucosamine--fructose-6-phosphate aminotransferase (isomerizing)
MCGIIAYIGYNEFIQYIINGLINLQNRGYDSAGIVSIINNKFITSKYASINRNNAIELLKNDISLFKEGNIGMGHTRWATHGAKTDQNSHPHYDNKEKISIIHNGIIENYQELKDKLIKEGYFFLSQTDTEVIANLISYNLDKGIEEGDKEGVESDIYLNAIQETIKVLEGTWGLVIMFIDQPNKLYVSRHGSPILISNCNDFVLISSEQSGFCGIANDYFCLNNNDLCIIDKGNGNGIKITTKCNYTPIKAIRGYDELSPEPYPHWTLKEIEEQIDSSLRAISMGGRLLSTNKVKLGGLEKDTNILMNIDNIILLGCGTSLNACTYGSIVFKELCDFNVVLYFDGADFNEHDIPLKGNTCAILLSQSGETKDLYGCMHICKENNIFMIGIINVVDSLIAREVNCGVYLNAGREMGVAATKSFSSQVIVLSMISIWFSQIKGTNNIKRMKYINDLRNLHHNIEETINISRNQMKNFLHLFKGEEGGKEGMIGNSCFILGEQKARSIANEGALKIKELCYIHSEGCSGSNLKHGPFGLLEEGFPIIMINMNDINYSKMNNIYHEVDARNAKILMISDNDSCIGENKIVLPTNESFRHLLAVIPMQYLAYYLSIDKGYNCDFPRNLAKTVTV